MTGPDTVISAAGADRSLPPVDIYIHKALSADWTDKETAAVNQKIQDFDCASAIQDLVPAAYRDRIDALFEEPGDYKANRQILFDGFNTLLEKQSEAKGAQSKPSKAEFLGFTISNAKNVVAELVAKKAALSDETREALTNMLASHLLITIEKTARGTWQDKAAVRPITGATASV